MKGNRIIVGALVAAIATVAGCTLTIDFDPRGVDVSLEGYWTIDGFAADSVSCGAAGIQTVQLVFYDGGVAYEFSEFEFPCSQGAWDSGFGVIDHGRYQTQWVAYGPGRVELGRGPMISLDVSNFSIDHAILAPVDFVTTGTGFNPLGGVGSLQANWTINGGVADAAACAAAGLQTMQFIFYDASDTARTDGVIVAMAPCADGVNVPAFDSGVPILAAGSYLTRISARDGSGAEVQYYDSPSPFVVTTAMGYGLMAADFTGAVVANELSINLYWGPGAPGVDCVTAGAEDIFWSLNDSGGGMVLSDTMTCAELADLLIFDDLLADDYSLFVDAESADRLTKWQGTCGGISHAGGTIAYDCFIDIMP